MGDTVGEVLEPRASRSATTTWSPPASTSRSPTAAGSRSASAARSSSASTARRRRYWVTATDVDSALDQLGTRFRGAELSASRGADIDRGGITLEVATPKRSRQGRRPRSPARAQSPRSPSPTSLDELDVDVDKRRHRQARASARRSSDGDQIVVTKVRVVTKQSTARSSTTTRSSSADCSMFEGETETVKRAGATACAT